VALAGLALGGVGAGQLVDLAPVLTQTMGIAGSDG